MRKLLALFLCVAPALVQAQSGSAVPVRQERGSLVLDGIPARDAALAEKLERYSNSRQGRFLTWLPDGGMLVGTRFGEVEQVHRVTAPLGLREQLTFYADPVSEARAPDTAGAEGFVFLKDKGGDENAQINYYRFADASVRMLTDGKSLNGNPVWSRDGKRLAYYSNARDGISYDIYIIVDIAAGTPARLAIGGQQDTWYPLDWSADGQKLLLWQFVSINESYLYIGDVNTGGVTPLDTSGRKVGIRAAKFAPDGRGIYIVSDDGSEFTQLRYFDPIANQTRKISADIQWDVEDFDVSADGRYIAVVTNEDGRGRLNVTDTVMKLELIPPGVPEGRVSGVRFDRAGRRLAFSAESAQTPRDAYVYDLEKSAVERWTRSEVGQVDTKDFAAAELVHYPTWDRVNGKPRTLSAFVYRPRTPGPHPVLINIHGGPEAQYRPGFEPFMQFLVNELGFAVVSPNVRGSSGYGKTFLKLDNGVLREDSVKDIGSLLVWIGVQPGFDRERIIVSGGSYGGYMTLASLVQYGDRLRGGVDVVGISNFVTFLNSTAPYRRDLRRAEYGDERDPKMRAFLSRISPLNSAKAIRRPLLVVQGLNDPRVPYTESQQMVATIRANGGEVWYLAAKDEGHGFRKKSNRDAYLETTAQFLQRLAQK